MPSVLNIDENLRGSTAGIVGSRPQVANPWKRVVVITAGGRFSVGCRGSLMCGLAGLVSLTGQPVSRLSVEQLTAGLTHRGPDGSAVWIAPNQTVGLGHTRLAIVDLSSDANQPMLSADGRYCIVFNGEIYNFVELAAELRACGVTLRTRGDTEVILEGYRKWGSALFDRLNGMWALVIHDVVTGETVLCRDRFGIKPLYVTDAAPQVLAFASEVSVLDRYLSGSCSPDTDFLWKLGHQDTEDRTHLQGVRTLLPGELWVVSRSGAIRREQWYRMPAVRTMAGLREQAAEFRRLFIDACGIQLRTNVPVATCLSGGVDSSSIVCTVHHHCRPDESFDGFNHVAFHASFPGTSQDETATARSLVSSTSIRLDCHRIDCPSPDELEEALKTCDGPMPSLAFYPIWRIYRHIRSRGIKVTLDGMGPDEYLGGYYAGRSALHAALQRRSLRQTIDMFRTYRSNNTDSTQQILRDSWSLLRIVLSRLKRRLLGRPQPTSRRPPWTPGAAGETLRQTGTLANALERTLWDQVFRCPLPFLLHQYDRCSMANGVEARFPLMDHRLLEFAFSLPLSSRVGGGYTKRILRESMRGTVPDSILFKKRKLGFNIPFTDWIQGPLRDWVGDQASSAAFRESSLFDGMSLSRTILGSLEARSSGSLQEWNIWMPLHLTWWLQNRKHSASAAAECV